MYDESFPELLSLQDLKSWCEGAEEESLILEFKSCNELRAGVPQKSGEARRREDVLQELSKDVSAMLNGAGGRIVYGIREKKSRANSLDENAFKGKDPRPETLEQWIRAHIQPSPSVLAYSIPAPDVQDSWYLVVEVPQGEEAYQARDKRFYKRVGTTLQPMEQYEVVDVMNRRRAAALSARLDSVPVSPSGKEGWQHWRLQIAVTSTNFVSSTYGAIKLHLPEPLRFEPISLMAFPGCREEPNAEPFEVPEAGLALRARSLMLRWGANLGNVVFPMDWYTFYGNPVGVNVPALESVSPDTYFFSVTLFTTGGRPRSSRYALRKPTRSRASVEKLTNINLEVAINEWKTTYDLLRMEGRL